MKHKILIVDDEEAVRRVTAEVFSGSYHVITAAEGMDAIGLIERERPVLVFLDLKMPGISGLEVLRRLKAAGIRPVVWMLTGEEDLDMAMQALELGAAGYLTKPFDIARIREIALSVVEDVSGEGKRASQSEKPWRVEKE